MQHLTKGKVTYERIWTYLHTEIKHLHYIIVKETLTKCFTHFSVHYNNILIYTIFPKALHWTIPLETRDKWSVSYRTLFSTLPQTKTINDG